MNFKTAAKIIFFIYPTLRCIGGLLTLFLQQLFTSYKMATLYFHKLWFQHLAIIKPFLINHIAIQVIVKDLHRIIFLVIEDEGFSIGRWVAMKILTDYCCQSFSSFSSPVGLAITSCFTHHFASGCTTGCSEKRSSIT